MTQITLKDQLISQHSKLPNGPLSGVLVASEGPMIEDILDSARAISENNGCELITFNPNVKRTIRKVRLLLLDWIRMIR